jgi:hypothetical protein
MNEELEQVGQRIIAGAMRTIRQCDELLRDVAYWNSKHAGERPITPDDELADVIAIKRRAQRMIRAVRNGQPIEED